MSSSRGSRDKVASSALLTMSMRDNYNTHGVEQYYRKVARTYRNPHFPGIITNLRKLFDSWHTKEQPHAYEHDLVLYDMACGSGEASVVYVDWCGKNNITPLVCASDPYTGPAYEERTSHTCSALSFRDVAEGKFPCLSKRKDPESTPSTDEIETQVSIVEWTVCSFALHLIEDNSELFALLWQLSTRSKWLIILAPHKKPEIKEGWGWMKWDIEQWTPTSMSTHHGELLSERVHCRLFRSLNL